MKVDTAIPGSESADPRTAAEAAEREGYDAVWMTEIRHDPLVQVALAATATSSVHLGTSIALAFARNPMSLAVGANDLQTITKGRFLLGVGSQIRAHIVHRFAMPWSHPAPRMREYLAAMHAIWDAFEHGTRLSFRGDFYSHTLLPPFFNPGPNPWGRPPVYLAGVGEKMTEVAGEAADGFFVHAFTTERYLREVTVPALERGFARRGARPEGFEISGMPFVATGRTEEELAAACQGVRAQIAFYGSTPAYRPVLELHGWPGLGEELHTLSVQNRWGEMSGLIDDDVLGAFAVVAEPDDVAAALTSRFGDLFTRASLYAPYDAGTDVHRRIAAELRGATALGRP
ncbi:TIGR03617 family F420-dependent LLM class oxidoreductase [Georgenia yuyongxinii]|uniref:TIGR03617 family F420-dependent LLM class oxidoreductase n=1 Tax=Georgenia yuyongxinii TaxID=2589797 RepID=A0A552WVL2_9MICO|nr:TIGR03617 family F420-dependent LLM class oxidoreductase [Georgenia yuyongxinii]TRW46880.1 TIGR03617 family F420-dependent LLM class oxidoreductase [Georgenia yuyongxinii]